ncbi:MAG: beta-ketoacyl synthase chain length factor [Proteobacteria bacterium]|nr:beta-ketoacyl synthase chain length factor [Pseudomonadota bacterium]
MSVTLELGVLGVGTWAPEWADWDQARRVLVQGAPAAVAVGARPGALSLPAGERRRAPESVLIAIEAAQQACAMAQRDPRELPHVFASAYGDLAINDYLCATLARTPGGMSPTKFHNSVHNAAAGYWAIAGGCVRAATAVSAGNASFGAGLLEAVACACAAAGPVLLVAYDIAARGPLAEVIPSRSAFAVALVLAPSPPVAFARVRLRTGADTTALAPARLLLHASQAGNPAAASLPLLAALARREAAALRVAAAPSLHLDMEISF